MLGCLVDREFKDRREEPPDAIMGGNILCLSSKRYLGTDTVDLGSLSVVDEILRRVKDAAERNWVVKGSHHVRSVGAASSNSLPCLPSQIENLINGCASKDSRCAKEVLRPHGSEMVCFMIFSGMAHGTVRTLRRLTPISESLALCTSSSPVISSLSFR